MIQVYTDSGFNWDNDRLVRVGGAPRSGIPQGATARYRAAILSLAQGYASTGLLEVEFPNTARSCRRETRVEVSDESGDIADVRAWLAATPERRAEIEGGNPFIFGDGWRPAP